MIPPVPRPPATMLVIAACGVLATGCGSGGVSSSTTATLSTSTPTTRAQALSYAHAINLHAADVPAMHSSFTEGEVSETASGKRSNAGFIDCYGGVSDSRRLLKIRSQQFSAGRAAESQTVESAVEVWPTSALALRNNSTYFSSRGRACFYRYLTAAHRQLNKQRNKQRAGKLEFGPLRVATVADPLPGVSHSFLRTISETLVRNGQIRVHIYHDIFTFVSGQAEVELEATGYSHPVPAASEERLLLLLVNRAKSREL